MADENTDTSAEAARAQAEARRKRILEKAQNRLGVVSGEQELSAAEKEEAAAKAARIRAARQRRYGKKNKASTTEGAAATTTTTTTAEDSQPAKDDAKIAAPTAEVEPPKGTPSAAESKSEEVEKKTEPPVDKSDDKVPTKKYKGVAKMRRTMIKKKKIEQSQAAEEMSKDEVVNVRPSSKVSVFPVYMQFVTVLLLFIAGLDIGLQQGPHEMANFRLSVYQHGLPVIHRSVRETSDERTEPKSLIGIEETFDSAPQDDEEEFAEETEDEKIPNIDPVFRVDLDEMTAGPGLLNSLARQAVSVHRLVLFLFFYLPSSTLKTLFGVPQALLQSPPALCLIAIILRQVFGKAIFGAGIPEADGKEDNGGAIDVIAMAKKFISSFVSNTFPMAAKFYEAFTHLRADIYVILCGVFTGLALVHVGYQSAPLGDIDIDPTSSIEVDPIQEEL